MASVGSSAPESGIKRVSLPSSGPFIIGIAVFTACAFGILTRPAGFFAMIWPANAVLLGLLVRLPEARRASVWLSAAAAYMLADLAANTDIATALLLNSANLCGVAAGYYVYRRLPDRALRMRDPTSTLYIVLVSIAAAAVTGFAGAIADPFLLKLGTLQAGLFWFVSELVNYIALLPVILSAPNLHKMIAGRRRLNLGNLTLGHLDLRHFNPASRLRDAVPTLALAASCVFALAVGGPGAIAFAVPTLLWCGIVYGVFTVSVLTFLFSCWSLTLMAPIYLQDVAGAPHNHAMISMRLAAFMIALAPVTLSIVMRNRAELVRKLSLARRPIDMVMDAGGITATWELNLTQNDLAEGEFPRRFAVDDKSGSGFFHDTLADLIHPDDRARMYDALCTAIATGTDYQCRCRIVTRNGEIRWFAVFGKPVRDRKGAVTHMTGILIDVTEQAETAEALEQSNTRFNIVSESIPQIVWSTDAKGRHDYFNCRWTEFTGIAPEDIRPETWEHLVHPDDKPRLDKVWSACLATGETYAIDYRFRYRDGTYRWLKVMAKPLRNANGAITRWYGTSTDIHDAKQLEAEREIVARELDHRIGNLFALMNGLVSFAARDGTDVKAMTESLRSRLSALHAAHGLIRRSGDTASTTLAGLLRRILAPYDTGTADTGTGRIAIGGDDLTLDPSAMTAIALIFHELATNAVKYGALKDCDGLLRIALGRSGDHFRICWREVSHSRATLCPGTGFGSKLFAAIVEGQLRGKATRLSSDDGLAIDIDLPISSLAGVPEDA